MLIKKETLPQVANLEMNLLHEEEAEIVNELYDAAAKGDVEKVEEMFKVFLQDIEDHFSTEEQMMKEVRYFAYPMHKGEHDTMKEKIYNLYEDFQKNKDTEKVKEFLEKEFLPWLILHISRWDSETAMHIGDSI